MLQLSAHEVLIVCSWGSQTDGRRTRILNEKRVADGWVLGGLLYVDEHKERDDPARFQ